MAHMPPAGADGPPREPWQRSAAAHLADRPAVRRCLVIALVVGTLLTAINHGDRLLHGTLSPDLAWKVPLTYCVPFLVASTGYISGRRRVAAGTPISTERPR